MAKFDKAVIIAYAVAMTILLVLGSCSLDLPIFILGAVVAFVSAVALIKQSHRPEEEI